LSCLFIVTRRGVIVETMLCAGVEMGLVFDLIRLKRLFESRPARIDAFVVLGIVDQQGCFDARGFLTAWLGAIEGHAGSQVWAPHGQFIYHGAAITKAHRAVAAAELWVILHEINRSEQVLLGLALI